jgi:hypothetical protein
MASQGNNPNKGNQKGGKQTAKKSEDSGKRASAKNGGAVPANMPGNKSRSGKFDSGKQTNR